MSPDLVNLMYQCQLENYNLQNSHATSELFKFLTRIDRLRWTRISSFTGTRRITLDENPKAHANCMGHEACHLSLTIMELQVNLKQDTTENTHESSLTHKPVRKLEHLVLRQMYFHKESLAKLTQYTNGHILKLLILKLVINFVRKTFCNRLYYSSITYHVTNALTPTSSTMHMAELNFTSLRPRQDQMAVFTKP